MTNPFRIGVLAITASLSWQAQAVQTDIKQGILDKTPNLVAFSNATIITTPGRELKGATLLIEDGKIKDILKNRKVPEQAKVIDANGLIIYPGFVDPYSQYGLKAGEDKTGYTWRSNTQYTHTSKGANATNDAIHAQVQWGEHFVADKAAATSFVKNGFTATQSARMDGIFRGQAFTASLAEGISNELIYNPATSQFASFDKGSSPQNYPTSLVGSFALIKQSLSDANWYASEKKKPNTRFIGEPVEYNAALEALANLNRTGLTFAPVDEHSQQKIKKVLHEFKTSATYLATGYEYSRATQHSYNNAKFIVPVAFPKAPEINGVFEDLDVSLGQLRHWEQASRNPAALIKSGATIAFTQYNLTDNSQFWQQVNRAIASGLDKTDALKALTINPAAMAGIASKAGQIRKGFKADFVIADGDLFENGKIVAVWTQGQENRFSPYQNSLFAGNYRIEADGSAYQVELTGKDDALKGKVTLSGETVDIKSINTHADRIQFNVTVKSQVLRVELEKPVDGKVRALVTGANGLFSAITVVKQPLTAEPEAKDDKSQTSPAQQLSKLTYPNKAFGLDSLPVRQNVHFKNATVWTSDQAGKLENTDIFVKNGKISKIGKNLTTPQGYIAVDATGKHITPGIVDEHSHIAIAYGVNESTNASSAEVQMANAINPDDIHIYRALAGGVTTAQLLHGSANPFGGQSGLIQLKWGEPAHKLEWPYDYKYIKFALGENVKQSNWGEDYTVRYPQTRLGVEAYMRDRFIAAKEYQQAHNTYDGLTRSVKRTTVAPRKDYQMEAIVEVINDKRDIHVHSYVQSEILALLNLADELNFTVDTFTHILEGYKVADEMAKHGAHGSTFADWWAYKFEVIDAIPQNTCLMAERGVLTSVNSDSRDLMRRLNTEAAKSIAYCGMSEIDALKMITINSATQLGIDKLVGSIRTGKQADIVMWSDNPLSSYAHVEQTWIEGKKYFDRSEDQAKRDALAEEKNRLVQKVLALPDDKKIGNPFNYKPDDVDWHCHDSRDIWQQEHEGAL